jgi:hypothetical protein
MFYIGFFGVWGGIVGFWVFERSLCGYMGMITSLLILSLSFSLIKSTGLP